MKETFKSKFAKAERNEKIYNLVMEGKTRREIGEKFGISYPRVEQIYNDFRKRVIAEEISLKRTNNER